MAGPHSLAAPAVQKIEFAARAPRFDIPVYDGMKVSPGGQVQGFSVGGGAKQRAGAVRIFEDLSCFGVQKGQRSVVRADGELISGTGSLSFMLSGQKTELIWNYCGIYLFHILT